MKTTIDSAGRLVIPREVRREAGLKPGASLDVRWRNGVVEIEPQPMPVRVAREGRLVVAVPREKADPLGSDAVERTRRALRRERASGR